MKKKLLILTCALILLSSQQTLFAQYYYDSVTFETPVTTVVITPSVDNIWQIGEPDKVFFTSAHSVPNAMVTDTLNNYPVNNSSSFTYIIRNPYTQTCITRLEFWHKYDMDSLNDIGTIEASYDGGNSWLIVKDTNLFDWGGSYFNWDMDYREATDDYIMHELNITGRSNGWIKSSFTWQWYIAVRELQDTIIINPDSLMIRFSFNSDEISENREGWMIDDILTSSGSWEICSGINEILLENNVNVFPNPFTYSTTLQLKNGITNGRISIYNTFGRKVMEMGNVSGKEITVFRDELPAGVYMLHLTDNNRLIGSKRLVIMD